MHTIQSVGDALITITKSDGEQVQSIYASSKADFANSLVINFLSARIKLKCGVLSVDGDHTNIAINGQEPFSDFGSLATALIIYLDS